MLGVDFFTGELDAVVDGSLSEGGLLVAPSAPGLAVDFVRSAAYREALLGADWAITDSGFMVLLWRLRTGRKLPRHSGLKFMRAVLEREMLREAGAVFWVMPSEEEKARTQAWLVAHGFSVDEKDFYLAPFYGAGAVNDEELTRRIEERKPRAVVLGIGGGVQERLGFGLKQRLSFRPAIFCTGAAIAFLSGGQASIPPWADRLMLGWLLRILSEPRKYWRRYWEALRLGVLLLRWRDKLPPLRG